MGSHKRGWISYGGHTSRETQELERAAGRQAMRRVAAQEKKKDDGVKIEELSPLLMPAPDDRRLDRLTGSILGHVEAL